MAKRKPYSFKGATQEELIQPYMGLSLRELTIVRQAALEGILYEALQRRLIGTKEEKESLLGKATFDQLIKWAYHTGVIDQEYRGLLNAIKDFRNHCAHYEHLDLSEPKAREALKGFRRTLLSILDRSEVTEKDKLADFKANTADLKSEASVRLLFLYGVAVLEGVAANTIKAVQTLV